jgi:hypothetical protein
LAGQHESHLFITRQLTDLPVGLFGRLSSTKILNATDIKSKA